ncbi:lactate/malate family dehydrogenase, partial [Haemophilus influenzae]
MKVAVLGAAGGIGQALALLLKLQLPAGTDLALYDIAPVTPGVAVDVSHIPTAVNVKGF